jgi:hypothetical protein
VYIFLYVVFSPSWCMILLICLVPWNEIYNPKLVLLSLFAILNENHLNYCFIKNKIGIRRECQGLGKSEFYKKKVYPGIKRGDLHYTSVFVLWQGILKWSANTFYTLYLVCKKAQSINPPFIIHEAYLLGQRKLYKEIWKVLLISNGTYFYAE